MSALTRVFSKETEKIEEKFFSENKLPKYRLEHHLMPPAGWLNDPNGLCWFQGKYHVFFQYSPFEVEGGLKFWGQYSSENLVEWKYEGVSLYPDTQADCHGVYSGSAFVEDGKMHLFYTGNVKLEDGDFDYINTGRMSNTIYVGSEDGIHFGTKKTVIDSDKYPEMYTCHIRDPKVWKDGDIYRMILGGRRKTDKGAALLYRSEDLINWEFDKDMTTEGVFGFMWECPDYFRLSGQRVLSVSPQGLEHEEYRFQNIYQSGYFLMDEDAERTGVVPKNFREWDMGFDFYAPQTFVDEKGRRILIAWMGMPNDQDEYVNLTVQEGWQHCLTVPRELCFHDGRVYQYPVCEMESLRGECQMFGTGKQTSAQVEGPFDLEMTCSGGEVHLSVGDDLFLDYENGKAVLSLSEKAGAGRKMRKACVESGELKSIRVLGDTSAAEIYLNDGEVVFSTRYYPESQVHEIKAEAADFSANLWKLHKMTFTK